MIPMNQPSSVLHQSLQPALPRVTGFHQQSSPSPVRHVHHPTPHLEVGKRDSGELARRQSSDGDQAVKQAVDDLCAPKHDLGPLADAGPPAVKLTLKKSASLLEWLNKRLAEQGQHCQEQSLSGVDLSSRSGDCLDAAGPSEARHHPQAQGLSECRSNSSQGNVLLGRRSGSCADDSGDAWRGLFLYEAESGTESMPLRQHMSARSDQSGSGAETGFLSGSQSQIDLDTFAASILLDDDPMDSGMSSKDCMASTLDQPGYGQPVPGVAAYSCTEVALTTPQFSPDQNVSRQTVAFSNGAMFNVCSNPCEAQQQQQQQLPGQGSLAAFPAFQGAGTVNDFLQNSSNEHRLRMGVCNVPDSFAAHQELHRTASLPYGRIAGGLTFEYTDLGMSDERVGGRCLGRTVSMPGTPRGSHQRQRRRSSDMLKPVPAGVAKAVGSPRVMSPAQSESYSKLFPEAFMGVLE